MNIVMDGGLTRKIGLERSKEWWGLKNLVINFLRNLLRDDCAFELA